MVKKEKIDLYESKDIKKSSKYYLLINLFLFGAFLFFSYGYFNVSNGKYPVIKAVAATTLLKEDKELSSQPLNYREAMIENIAIGQSIVFKGKITQAMPRSNRAFMATKERMEGIYIGDLVNLIFSDKPKMISGDIFEIRGRYDGLYEYKMLTGSYNAVPSIVVDSYTLIKPRD